MTMTMTCLTCGIAVPLTSCLTFWNRALFNLTFWNLDEVQDPFWNRALFNLTFWNLDEVQDLLNAQQVRICDKIN
jgi:cell shape-determining protein MreD